jgi:hypothetical protein
LKETPEEEQERLRKEALAAHTQGGEGTVTGTGMPPSTPPEAEKPPSTETPPEATPPAQVSPPTQVNPPEEAKPPEGTPSTGPAAQNPATPAAPTGMPGAVPGGPLPSIMARPAKETEMAIVLTGVGLSRSTLEVVFTLPAVVTLSFSPYASRVEEMIKEAAAQGYEVLLDLPAEPSDYPLSDPGPLALLTTLSEKQNMEQVDALAAISDQIAGFLLPVDEQFSYSVKSISPVLGGLSDKKLPLIYSAKPGNYFVAAAAQQLKEAVVPYGNYLDDQTTKEAIWANFNETAAKARAQGTGVAVVRPYPITVDTINAWLASPDARGIRIVPVSKLATGKEPDAKEKPQIQPAE